MLQNYSSGYCLWETRIDEQAVKRPVVSTEIFCAVADKLYSNPNGKPLLVQLDGSHMEVYASDEIKRGDTLAIPIEDDSFRHRLPIDNAGVLVAKEWFVDKMFSLEREEGLP